MKLNKLLTTALQKNPKITKKQYKHLKKCLFYLINYLRWSLKFNGRLLIINKNRKEK